MRYEIFDSHFWSNPRPVIRNFSFSDTSKGAWLPEADIAFLIEMEASSQCPRKRQICLLGNIRSTSVSNRVYELSGSLVVYHRELIERIVHLHTLTICHCPMNNLIQTVQISPLLAIPLTNEEMAFVTS